MFWRKRQESVDKLIEFIKVYVLQVESLKTEVAALKQQMTSFQGSYSRSKRKVVDENEMTEEERKFYESTIEYKDQQQRLNRTASA